MPFKNKENKKQYDRDRFKQFKVRLEETKIKEMSREFDKKVDTILTFIGLAYEARGARDVQPVETAKMLGSVIKSIPRDHQTFINDNHEEIAFKLQVIHRYVIFKTIYLFSNI